jgi:DNA-binding ferritin-like protein
MNVRIWNQEQEAKLLDLYCNEEKSVDDIAEYFEKNHRSVISKLVQLKVYRKPEAEKPIRRTVKSMIKELEDILEISIDGVNLSKKENLEVLVDAIKNRLD